MSVKEIKLEDKSKDKIELWIKANKFLFKNELILGSILLEDKITIDLKEACIYNEKVKIKFADNSFKKIKKINFN